MKPWETLAFQRGQSYVKRCVGNFYDLHSDQSLMRYMHETGKKCKALADKHGHSYVYPIAFEHFIRAFPAYVQADARKMRAYMDLIAT